MDENSHRENISSRAPEESQNRMWPESQTHRLRSGQMEKQKLYLGCLTKCHLITISVAFGLVILVIVIVVTAIALTKKSGSSGPLPSFPTGGDMLDYLVQMGDISNRDGLLATWAHRANSKEEMNKALAGDAMILESDVTLEGYGTPNVKPIPIMAHPPDIYSDNTLDQWLDAVLASRKAIKLDFKSLESVGLSLDLLIQKNSSKGINRPVWLNADILHGPNSPDFLPLVNGTRFLQLIQEKFPDVTVSPGWRVLYVPPIFIKAYSRSMMNDMYNLIKDVPQKVTFPIYVLLAGKSWQHISWLLSQSSRFSLTMWQGSIHPNISDLLFIRDNTHPARVYFDIYEPTLSAFRQAVYEQGRLRRFYSGGDLMDFLHPFYYQDNKDVHLPVTRGSSLSVHWFTVTDRISLVTQLLDGKGGMLVVQLTTDNNRPGAVLVESSGNALEALTLQDILQLLRERTDVSWGVYLRVPTQQLLQASLTLLQSANSREELYRPIWISMEGLQSIENTEEFVSTVESLFPYVTLVLAGQNWPPLIPGIVSGLSQRVALHLNATSLPTGNEVIYSLVGMMDKFDLIIEDQTRKSTIAAAVTERLMVQHKGRANTNLYIIPHKS
ncbi:protein FAM151A [Antennarius striatus]|uniref:protein FAM151A n=1 Tax=Antennarius striatus TaxID=241820 RepID=UPI0035B2A203